MAELFRNESACLRANSLDADVDDGCLVISFAPWSGRPGLDGLGWAEALCESQRWPALHVMSAQDDWYQSEGAQEVVDRAARIARGYSRVVTYGSSMGGYAALNFATELGARIALAIAPQFSIDRAKVGFETRWSAEAGRTAFVRDRIAAISPQVRPVLVYDPWFAPDARHVELIARHCEPVRVPLPLMGHDGAGARILKPMLAAARADDWRRMRDQALASYRQIRKGMPGYYLQLVERARGLSADARLALLRRAHAIDAGHIGVALKRSSLLLAQARPEEALRVQEEALRLAAPAFVPLLHSHRAQALAALARDEDALAAARQARELSPQHPYFAHQLAQLLGRAGQAAEALSHQRVAVALHRDNAVYQAQLANLERAARAAAVSVPAPDPSRLGDAARATPAAERAALWSQARAVEPSYSGAAARFSSALLARGAWLDALAVQDEALRQLPDTPLLLSHRALALVRLGRFGEAEASLGRAIALAPQNAYFRHQRAGLWFEAGRLRQAEQEQLIALQCAPAQADYREQLERIRHRIAASPA